MSVRVSAEVAARWLVRLGVPVRSATIRQWARRGHITSTGSRRGAFDLAEVQRHAEHRGLI